MACVLTTTPQLIMIILTSSENQMKSLDTRIMTYNLVSRVQVVSVPPLS